MTERRTKNLLPTIPYVETFDEQSCRIFWESDPFDVVKSIIHRLMVVPVDGNSLKEGPYPLSLLRKMEEEDNDDGKEQRDPTGYEYLFNILYYGDDRKNEESSTHQNLYHHLQRPCDDDNDSKDNRQEQQRCFLLRLVYRGSDFCGWQTQPKNVDLPSVQQTLEECLAELEGNKVNIRVCGRTDAGVNAIGQVARYRSRQKDMTAKLVQDHLRRHLPSTTTMGLRCLDVLPVTKSFHPSFGAQARAYLYLLDTTTIVNPTSLAQRLDIQLKTLQGRTLDYVALSYGRIKTQTSICTLYHAQAHVVQDTQTGQYAIAVELVSDRFLRRMVRLLVENALRFALRPIPQSSDTLLELVESRDRSQSAKPSPPDGLVFVGAIFEDP